MGAAWRLLPTRVEAAGGIGMSVDAAPKSARATTGRRPL